MTHRTTHDGRHLDWDGCFNARDLGGLATMHGTLTPRGAFVRADSAAQLTRAGWAAALAHGVHTIIDLRNEDEIGRDLSPRPADLVTVHVPIDDAQDVAFWTRCRMNELDGTPLYYRSFLDQKSGRCAAVVRAIASAPLGGVLFHCVAGRDRTGLVSILLLGLAGVVPDDIAADYELSIARLRARAERLGEEDWGAVAAGILARKGTTTRRLVLDLLASLDVEMYLRKAGVDPNEIAMARARLAPRS